MGRHTCFVTSQLCMSLIGLICSSGTTCGVYAESQRSISSAASGSKTVLCCACPSTSSTLMPLAGAQTVLGLAGSFCCSKTLLMDSFRLSSLALPRSNGHC